MARKDTLRRGSRRSASPPPSPPRKPQAQGWRLWLRRLVVWGAGFALLGAIFLGVAVAVTARSLPGYAALKSSQVGQTILVRAADGTEIVTLGPSYGHWIPSSQIPQVMKDAMVSIEDRRFRSHFGVDPLGLARAVFVSLLANGALENLDQDQVADRQFLNADQRTQANCLGRGAIAKCVYPHR